jgi:hypothetical protein
MQCTSLEVYVAWTSGGWYCSASGNQSKVKFLFLQGQVSRFVLVPTASSHFASRFLMAPYLMILFIFKEKCWVLCVNECDERVYHGWWFSMLTNLLNGNRQMKMETTSMNEEGSKWKCVFSILKEGHGNQPKHQLYRDNIMYYQIQMLLQFNLI